MKTKNLITAILLLFAGVFYSCSNEPEKPEINFPREVDFTEFSLWGTSCRWVSIYNEDGTFSFVDTLFVINSDDGLKNHIHCLDENSPKIDFLKHTLLRIDGKVTHQLQKIIIRLIQHSEYKYDLNIISYRSDILTGGIGFDAILVPKISNDAKVVLNVEYRR